MRTFLHKLMPARCRPWPRPGFHTWEVLRAYGCENEALSHIGCNGPRGIPARRSGHLLGPPAAKGLGPSDGQPDGQGRHGYPCGEFTLGNSLFGWYTVNLTGKALPPVQG